MARRRIHVLVVGRVQGVFFRRTTFLEATRLGVAGWVRNRTDGMVEIEAEGSEEVLENFLAFCRQGPEHARVDEVRVVQKPARGEAEFRVAEDA
jgi:acylphosphatase